MQQARPLHALPRPHHTATATAAAFLVHHSSITTTELRFTTTTKPTHTHTMADTLPVKVTYCGVCTLPPEVGTTSSQTHRARH